MNSLEALAGQTLVIGFPAGPPPADVLDASRKGALGGVILFKRNLGEVHEVASLLDQILACAPPDQPLLTSVDQEGGRVARLGSPVLKLPPMQKLAAIDDIDLTFRAASLLGAQLRAIGFSMDFAPVLDVDTNPDNPVIGDRAFGKTPGIAAKHAIAFAKGLEKSGVAACGKHFPGHGDTLLDSHLALPRLSHDRQRLDAVELAPFRAAIRDVGAVMTAHVVFDALDPGVPATLSARIIQGLLRTELGYEGVIVSDDLEMKAIANAMEMGEAAVRAIRAGCDLLLVCSKPDLAFEARRAIAVEASRSAEFKRRLEDAGTRSLALRRRFAPRPIVNKTNLLEALNPDATGALEREIAVRLSS